ncbi:MAG: bifunctional (p)ppGpp synthetase/guanosine-3',5'-bis(diphosphate) 3'-pyrophosphohydrolase, partial [Methylococcales bacterium]|nr:bifunctional (p)ppGpp synthetase/guanosine-3',5'-bis(diphosphate) 3'-pyrophosphohydrolase [Methylococcales bacterium]
ICNCCKPAPGKNIIAYKSRGLEFSIHEASCKTVAKLDSHRFVEADFNIIYSFKINAIDRIGLLRDYANVMSEHGLNIIDSKFDYNKKKNISCWYFSVEISSPRESEDMIADLKKVPNVIDIKTIKDIDKKNNKT